MIKKRYLTQEILQDLQSKMVFLGGARQVGKTTLAQKIIAPYFKSSTYFNWDYQPDRKRLMNHELPANSQLLILDEIHKYSDWKNFLKGLYDKYKEKYTFLITGSARLNIYRRGGDSLLGRYHYYTLHPFSLAEIINKKNRFKPFEPLDILDENYYNDYLTLKKFSGFPEVLIKQSERFLRRWQLERIERLFKEEVRDLTTIQELSKMKLLIDILPERVSSLLSVNALREDLEVSHKTISYWLEILEWFYYHFRVYPFHLKKIRSTKKTPKMYLVDWSSVEDEGAKHENIIAEHLMKFVDYLRDYEGYEARLWYLRAADKREVDFHVTVNMKPWFSVEAKLKDTKVARPLKYFKKQLNIPFSYQVVEKENIDFIKDDIRVVSVDRFLSALV